MANIQALAGRISKPPYYWIMILIVLLLFGDSTLLFIGHLLHVVLEFITAILEHFLQSTFNFKKRTAQILVFYFELIVGIYVTWRLSLVFCQKCKLMWLLTYSKLKHFFSIIV
jgi:hypothetical protein